MPDSMEQSEYRRDKTPSTGPIGNAAVACLPVLACFLGGATQKWAESIVVALLGLLLLVRPPRFSLGWLTNILLLALVATAAVAFLPHQWFFKSAWRASFTNDFGINLPSTLSPQPWISLSCLLSLVAGLSWFYLVCTQEIDLREARGEIRIFTAGIILLAGVCLLLRLGHTTMPFWHNERNFGPFPNRNQTGDLFGLAAIVSIGCGQDDLRKGRKRWLFWAAGIGMLIAAVIISFSRAGIGILVAGSALWLGIFSLRQRSPSRIAIAVSVLLLLFTSLLIFGGETLERFHLREIGNIGITTDFRWRIFHDTFDLLRDSAWCGIGLGNFEPVFAIFRNASLNDTYVIHPESDWLWFWSEAGWPAVLLTVAVIASVTRRIFPLREGTNQRYRLATFIAALLFIVHGFVDVSGHRVGTAFAATFLFGLSLHRPLSLNKSFGVSIFFRFIGFVLTILGAFWLISARTEKLLPGSIGVSNAKQLASIASRGRDFTEAAALATRGLEWAPLDWQLYFSRALAEVELKQVGAAIEDFRRARFLQPGAYEVPLAEGNAWLAASRPVLVATAWREALRRAGPVRSGVFAMMLNSAALRSPRLSQILEEMGLQEHDLALPYLSHVSGPAFNRGLTEVLRRDPDLHTFTETEKMALFSFWSDRGDPDQLAEAVKQHPSWSSYAWLGMAKYYASKGDFRSAYKLTQQYGEAVALPRFSSDSSLLQLESQFRGSPESYAIGYELYRAQIREGRVDDALQTVRHFSERPISPPYFRYLEAQAWADKQNWERAWNAWQAFHSAQSRATK